MVKDSSECFLHGTNGCRCCALRIQQKQLYSLLIKLRAILSKRSKKFLLPKRGDKLFRVSHTIHNIHDIDSFYSLHIIT